jgi:hypothetical protein
MFGISVTVSRYTLDILVFSKILLQRVSLKSFRQTLGLGKEGCFNFLHSVIIHSANGGKGEGCLLEEYSVPQIRISSNQPNFEPSTYPFSVTTRWLKVAWWWGGGVGTSGNGNYCIYF